jgi:phasin family protein
MTSSNQQNAESAVQVTEWMRNMTDQLLNQSKMMWEGSLTTARDAFEGVDQQASEIRGRLLSLTEATLANSFDFAHKTIQARGPQDLLQLESEFISKQAQLIAEQSKQLGESAMRGAQEVGRMTSRRMEETSRRAAQAA